MEMESIRYHMLIYILLILIIFSYHFIFCSWKELVMNKDCILSFMSIYSCENEQKGQKHS
jgi:hypothetical protein